MTPGQEVTVWSSDAEHSHEPPDHLVMKGQKWASVDHTTTSLFNSNGEEVAASERSRQYHATSTSRQRDSGGSGSYMSKRSMPSDYHQEQQGEERCSIM